MIFSSVVAQYFILFETPMEKEVLSGVIPAGTVRSKQNYLASGNLELC